VAALKTLTLAEIRAFLARATPGDYYNVDDSRHCPACEAARLASGARHEMVGFRDFWEPQAGVPRVYADVDPRWASFTHAAADAAHDYDLIPEFTAADLLTAVDRLLAGADPADLGRQYGCNGTEGAKS
jgi:hypothetical protein